MQARTILGGVRLALPFAIAVMASLGARTEARASVLTVTSAADGGRGSLRDAISGAKDGDTIVFDETVRGQITLTSGSLVIKKDIDIEGPGCELYDPAAQAFLPAASLPALNGAGSSKTGTPDGRLQERPDALAQRGDHARHGRRPPLSGAQGEHQQRGHEQRRSRIQGNVPVRAARRGGRVIAVALFP
jgi:hypothetical protein